MVLFGVRRSDLILQQFILIPTLISFSSPKNRDGTSFFDGTKSPNMNLAATKLMMLTCQPPFNKLPPATRHHDEQYPRFKSLMATAFDGEKTC
jgi:hypothetical protein